ncbi:hypothetical protein Moror_7380 [Moniliophthora roreri MCA 2997]|uniref:Uncharacterized protein n=2 Tax=Moniliophthora roreri TaxID=221103 RepID=V2XU16_MONRO|nr:hypothetical protein Moror_7380 [Moniliophthora roreri MCA 2997]
MLNVRSTSGSSLSARSITDPPASTLFDFNVVSAFFLGCLFAVAAQCLCSSLSNKVLQFCIRRPRPETRYDVETQSKRTSFGNKKAGMTTDNDTGVQILLFIMFICFALGSVADLASLTSLKTEGSCAFFVSWGMMAAKLGRLVGLIILLIALHRLMVPRWESFMMITWSVVLFVMILVNGALNTGTVDIPQNLGIPLCYRKHVVAASVVSSLLYMFFELYFIIRFSVILFPRASHERARATADLLWDSRLRRAWSLLFLEVLAIAPTAVPLKTIDQYIPLVIGSISVLITFGCSASPSSESRVPAQQYTSPLSTEKPHPTPVGAPYPLPPAPPSDFQGQTRSPATSDSNGILQFHRSPSVPTVRSAASVDSAGERSVRNARVQLATRSSHPYLRHIVPPGLLSEVLSRPASEGAADGQDVLFVQPSAGVLSAVPAHLTRQFSRGTRPKLTVITNFTSPDGSEERSAVATVYTFYSHPPVSAPERSHFSVPSPSDISATTVRTSNENIVTESGAQSLEIRNPRQSVQLTGVSHMTAGTFGPNRPMNPVSPKPAQSLLGSRMDPSSAFRPRGPRLRNALP